MKEKHAAEKADAVKRITEYIENLMQGGLTDIGTPVKKAIDDLTRMDSKINIIDKKIKTLEEYQLRMRENW